MPAEREVTEAEHRKAEIGEHWDTIAEKWDAWGPFVDQWFGPATVTLLDMLHISPGERVLELAAGSGGFTRHLAHAVGPEGRVLATDLGPNMVKLAARNLRAAGVSNVVTRVMDGENPDLSWASMDVVVSRQGVMFFADPGGAFERLIRVLRPGGRIGVTVFSAPERNGFITTPMGILSRWSSPDGVEASPVGGPGPFALSAPGLLESLFQRAGFVGVESRTVPLPLRLSSVEELLRFDREILGDPLSEKTPDVQKAAWRAVADASSGYVGPGSTGAPCEFLVVTGKRPAT
jgi:ubiquinone/menaquinone biosynthesis C-methylase UbiE